MITKNTYNVINHIFIFRCDIKKNYFVRLNNERNVLRDDKCDLNVFNRKIIIIVL